MARVSRTENSLLNINFSLLSQIVKIIFSFTSRTIFIHVLGKEILGINGVYASILSYLALSELGIGSAVTFTLYKPIAEHNIERIKSIVHFYRRVYKIIGLIILASGVLLMPFLQIIVKDYQLTRELYVAYVLYVFTIASSYLLFSYRQVLLVASQEKHRIEKSNIVFYILTNSIQIAFLLLTRNYLVYLIINIVLQNVQQFLIYRLVGKDYPYTREKQIISLTHKEKMDIGKSVYSIALFKLGAVILNSTDNIIISAFIGVAVVGVYSNYHLLISTVTGFIGLIFTSLTASVGNLNVTSSSEKSEAVFKRIFVVSTIMYSAAGMILFQMLNPFINLWLGHDYLFSDFTAFFFAVDFILAGYMIPIDLFKDACGVFRVGRYRPLLTVLINIVLSIILAQSMGVAGIILATSISRLLTTFWIDSRYVYKIVFKKSVKDYYLRFAMYFSLSIVGICVLYTISSIVRKYVDSAIVLFIITLVYSIVLVTIYILGVYRKRNEFCDVIEMGKKYLPKRIIRRNG